MSVQMNIPTYLFDFEKNWNQILLFWEYNNKPWVTINWHLITTILSEILIIETIYGQQLEKNILFGVK